MDNSSSKPAMESGDSKDSKKPKDSMSLLRKRLRLLGLLLILFLEIAYLLVNVNSWVNTPYVRDRLLKTIFRRFWTTIKVEHSVIDLKRQTAHIYGPEVYERNDLLVGKASYVRVRMNLFALAWLEIRIQEVEVDQPWLHMWTDVNRRFFWRDFKMPPKPNRLTATRAGTIIAHNGTYIYDYFPVHRPLHLKVTGVNGKAEFIEKTAQITATADRLHLRFPGFDHYFENVSVEGTADRDFVQVDRLETEFLNIPLKAKGRLDDLTSKNPRMNIFIEAAGSIGDLLTYFNYKKKPPGPFKMTAHVTERTYDYRVAGTFTSSWGKVEGQRYDNTRAKYTYRSTDRTIRLSSFSFDIYGAHVTGAGWYEIDTRRFSGTGTIRLRQRTLSYSVAGIVNYDTGVITFDRLNLWTPFAKYTSKGTWATKTGLLDFNWTLAINNTLREFPYWGLDDIGGAFTFSGSLQGLIRDLYVTSRGNGKNVEWRKFLLGNGPVTLDFRDGELYLKANLQAQGSEFMGRMSMPVVENGTPVDLTRTPISFHIEIADRKLTPEFFGTDIHATAHMFLDGGGTFGNLRGNGGLELRDIVAWGQRVESVEAEMSVGANGIHFTDAELKLPGGDLALGYLKLNWDLDYDLYLYSNEVNLSSLDAVSASDRPATGTAQVGAIGWGNFRKPHVLVEAIFSSLKYETLDLENAELMFNIEGSMATIYGEQPWGISFAGDYDLSTKAFNDFRVIFDQVDLMPFSEWRNLDLQSGNVTGSLIMNGGEEGWDDVDYHIQIRENGLHVEYIGENIHNLKSLRVEIGPDGGTQDIHLVSDHGFLSITGTLSPQYVWDLDIAADLDMGILPGLSKKIRSGSGRLYLEMRATGPSDNLIVTGQSSMEDGSLRFRDYAADFSEITGVVEFTPQSYEIRGITGKIDEDGSFDITGKIFAQGFIVEGISVTIEANRAPFHSPGVYKAFLSPTLTIQGTPEKLALKGEIIIDNGQYFKDVRIERQFVEVKRETTPPREMPKWMKNLEMDVVIIDEGNFLIKNNMAEVPMMINLGIRGTPGAPVVNGAVETIGGRIFYFGTIFDIVHGSLDFADPLKIDPMVNVFASTNIREYEIRLYIEGVLSHMELRLESSPQLDDQNILSLVTFQRTVDELTEGEQMYLLNLSLLFSRDVSRSVGSPLESFTGLDIFTIEAREDTPGTRVTVGKRISKRIEVQYSSDMGGEAPLQETRLIYKLTDNIWLMGSQDSLGVYSFKLNFHFELR